MQNVQSLPIYAYETPNEVETCSLSADLLRSTTIVKLIKMVVLVVLLAFLCLLGISCSYM